jgi:hypothetical protein
LTRIIRGLFCLGGNFHAILNTYFPQAS